MRRRLIALGMFACAAVAGACGLFADIPDSVTFGGTDAAQPLCDGPIRIRALNATDSVTVADLALPVYLGALDYLREINETGGIRGCQLEWEFTQVGFGDPTSAIAAYEAYRAQPVWNDVVAFFGISSADTLALGPRVQEDKKVLFSMAYNGTIASPDPKTTTVTVPNTSATFQESTAPTQIDTVGYPYVFFPGTDYSTAMRLAMQYVASINAGARVGFATCRANEFCINPLNAGKAYGAEQGLAIGRPLYVELTDRQNEYGAAVAAYFGAEAAQVQRDPAYKPVSWLWAGNLTAGTFFLAATMGQLSQLEPAPDPALQPVWARARELMASTKIIANNYGFDESLPDLCGRLGAGAIACSKIFGVMPFLAFGDTSTAAADMPGLVALHDKWRARDANVTYIEPGLLADAGVPQPTTRSVRYVQGHMNVELLKTAIERVADAHQRVTGETLKAALESFRSVDTGGLTAPLSFTAKDHRPQSSLSVYQVLPPLDGGAGGLTNVAPNQRIPLKDEWLGW